MSGLTVEEVMEKRIVLRDKRSELKKDFDEENTKLKDGEEQCEVWLLKRARELGVSSFKCDGIGTAFRSIDMKVSCADWNTFHDWILVTQNIDALERRVSRKFIQEYRKEESDLPPGVNIFEEEHMTVRRLNSIKED